MNSLYSLAQLLVLIMGVLTGVRGSLAVTGSWTITGWRARVIGWSFVLASACSLALPGYLLAPDFEPQTTTVQALAPVLGPYLLALIVTAVVLVRTKKQLLRLTWVGLAFISVAIGFALLRGDADSTLEVPKILQQTRATASAIPDASAKSSAFDAIVQVQARAGDIGGAMETLKTVDGTWSRYSAAVALANMAENQTKEGDRAAAAETFRLARLAATSIQDEKDLSKALSAIAQAQARAGDIKGALQTVASLPSENSRAVALITIAEAQAKGGDRAGAAETFRLALQAAATIQDAPNKFYAFGEIAQAQAKSGDRAGAAETFRLALQAATTIQDEVTKSGILYSIAVAQARAGDGKGALQTAGTIPNKGLQALALPIIPQSQAQAGDMKGALETLAAMPTEYKPGILLGIAYAQAKAGDVQGALQTADAIQSGRSKSEARGVIAQMQATAGDVHGALRTAAAIEDPRPDPITQTLDKKIDAYQGMRTASAFQKDPRIVRSIAHSQATAGDVQGALQTAKAIQMEPDKSSVLGAIAESQAKAGDVQGALQTAAAIQKEPYKSYALRAIAHAQVTAGDIQGARQTAAGIQEPIKSDVLRDIAKPSAPVKGRGPQTVGTSRTKSIKSKTLRAIAKVQASAGDVKGALQTAAIIPSEQIKSEVMQAIADESASAKAKALSRIAVTQATDGDFQSALQTAASIQKDATKAEALRSIAHAQAKAGHAQGALAWAEKEPSPLFKTYALLGAASGILERKHEK